MARTDGPAVRSLRPSKNVIESTYIDFTKSDSKRFWSIEEDVFLIRCRERDRMSWPQVREVFPHRGYNASELRYNKYLAKSEVSSTLNHYYKL